MLFKKRVRETINIIEYVNPNKTFRDLIEVIYMKNSKGNNGLIVKKIMDNCSPEEISFVENEIKKVNDESFKGNIWHKSGSELYSEFTAKIKKQFDYPLPEERLEQLFILFTMNYVFVAYKNKGFRGFLSINKSFFYNK